MTSVVRWNFTIPDTSPMFTYKPYGDGHGLGFGWQTWYTGPGFNNVTGASPIGDSFHLTSLPDASVSLSFYGIGIVLRGTANCTYTVTLDNNIVPTSNSFGASSSISDVLFASSSLSPGIHDVTLTAQPSSSSQILSFSGGLISSIANSTLSSSSPQTVTYLNQNTSITYTGTWQANKTVSGVPSAQSELPFHTTSEQGASAHLNFTGRAVAVYGSTTFGHGLYTVNLDGKQSVLNGTSVWLIGNMLLFYQDGLDESVEHSLNLTDSSDGQPFSLNSVVVTQFNPDNNVTSAPNSGPSTGGPSISTGNASKSSSNVAKIVAPIVSILGALVIGILAFFLVRRRRHSAHAQLLPSGPDSGSGPKDGGITPFPFVAQEGRAPGPPLSKEKRDVRQGGERETVPPPAPIIRRKDVPGSPPVASESSASILVSVPAPASESVNSSTVQASALEPGVLVSPGWHEEESLVNRIVEMVSRRIDPRPQTPGVIGNQYEQTARPDGADVGSELEVGSDAGLPPYREPESV